MKRSCAICEQVKRLVRDHNHTTGMIRGLLCDQCNGRLGTYEKNQSREKQRGRWGYRAWVRDHGPRIIAHLQASTGERYVGARDKRDHTIRVRTPDLDSTLYAIESGRDNKVRSVYTPGTSYGDTSTERGPKV